MIDISNMIENAIYTKIYGNAFLVDLKDFQYEKKKKKKKVC